MSRIIILVLGFFMSISAFAQNKFKKHTLSPGLVMAGYQGWFGTPTDGADRGWYHYNRRGKFEPGWCTIDMWPDMNEYEIQYETAFWYEDDTPAKIFSSHDESTVRLHFRWMKEYGLDGVYMQRFVAEIKSEKGRNHFNKVLQSATNAASDYDRTIAIMYDMSGMVSADTSVIMEDWKKLLEKHQYHNRSSFKQYLFKDDRPLVAIWGAGFNDGRKYNMADVERLIKFFKSDAGGNCAVLLGVPTFWREQGRDCVDDQNYLDILKMADVIHPWFVGRFRSEAGYDQFMPDLIRKDKEWCDKEGLAYIPVVFPGFSWNNMKPGAQSSTIPRNGGDFMWNQLKTAANQGAELLYIAMFDEVDEGTAIFKVAHRVPVGESTFIPMDEGIETDHFLWMTGEAARMLKKGKTFPDQQIIRK